MKTYCDECVWIYTQSLDTLTVKKMCSDVLSEGQLSTQVCALNSNMPISAVTVKVYTQLDHRHAPPPP